MGEQGLLGDSMVQAVHCNECCHGKWGVAGYHKLVAGGHQESGTDGLGVEGSITECGAGIWNGLRVWLRAGLSPYWGSDGVRNSRGRQPEAGS